MRFGRNLLRSKDIDPLYPVLEYIQREWKTEQRLWHSLLYVAWYNLPSGQRAFDRFPKPRDKRIYGAKFREEARGWPTGVERRNNRGGRVFDHLSSFCTVTDHTTLTSWFRNGFVATHGSLERRHRNWQMLNERLQVVHGNGRWAAYKHCEVLRRVNGFPVEAPDMGHRFSSGPREGLATLYGPLEGQGEAVIAVLDRQGRDLQERLSAAGLDVDIEELETILCNWKSLLKGKYYVGHDIDELQAQIEAAPLSSEQRDLLLEARAATLPEHYLGEIHGWSGVQERRMKAYRDRGKVLVRKP